MKTPPVRVPWVDLQAACTEIRDELDNACRRVLDRGRYILGEEVEAFEREFADYVGAPHAVGVANGTEALQLALWAGGIQPGDRVLTVSHTATATVASIELAGRLAITERARANLLCLPMHPTPTPEGAHIVTRAMAEWFQQRDHRSAPL